MGYEHSNVICSIEIHRKEINMQDKLREQLMTELEEGWSNLTLTDWYAIRATLVTATIRETTGPLPEDFKQELISQIQLHGSSLTGHDLHDMHEQIALAKKRSKKKNFRDLDDCLYGTDGYVSTR